MEKWMSRMEKYYVLRDGLTQVDEFLTKFYEFIEQTIRWETPWDHTKEYWDKFYELDLFHAINNVKKLDNDSLIYLISVSYRAIYDSYLDGTFDIGKLNDELLRVKEPFAKAVAGIPEESYEQKTLANLVRNDFGFMDRQDIKDIFIYPIRSLFYKRYLDKMMGVEKCLEFDS